MDKESEPRENIPPPVASVPPPQVSPVPPSTVSPPPSPTSPKELGEVEGIFGWVKALLKQPLSVAWNVLTGKGPAGTNVFLVVFILCHLAYGLIMGLFSGESQLAIVPLKLVLGTAVGALLCYPSLYIFASLSGADVSPGKVFSLLVGGLAMCSLLLVGFLPVSFIFTFSVKSVNFMGMVHLGIWVISILFGCRYIRQGLSQGARDGNGFLYLWNVVLILTLLQMGTTLRPLLGPHKEGDPIVTTEKKFFLLHWGERAYGEEVDVPVPGPEEDPTPEVRAE